MLLTISRKHLTITLSAIFMAMLMSLTTWNFSTLSAHAASNIYYVSPTGSDSASGTSIGTAFQHIQECATVMQPGDTCLIETGIYHEAVTPARSGTASAAITYQTDAGAQVTIDGADPVTGWSLSSGNIYTASVTLPVASPQDTGFLANQIFVDQTMQNEARWPSSGLDQLQPKRSTAGANSTTSTIYDSALPNMNWTGAIVHFWGAYDPFSSQTGVVTASSDGQITFSGGNCCNDPNYMAAGPGSKYYLTGTKSALDAPGEWYYDGAQHVLSLWTSGGDSPANHTVEAKQRTNAFNLNGISYTTVRGISTFANTITTNNTSQYDVFDSLSMMDLSHYTTLPSPPQLSQSYDYNEVDAHVFDSGVQLYGAHHTLENSTIAYSAGNGVLVQGSYITVSNNIIHDVDYEASYAAGIEVQGDHNTLTRNSIYNTGREGINFQPLPGGTTFQNNTISYNDIAAAAMLLVDAGGIYGCCVVDSSGTSIDHNWIHDNAAHLNNTYYVLAGIYLDGAISHMTVDHNVLWNNTGVGLQMNGQQQPYSNPQYNQILNNTFGGGQSSSMAIAGPSDTTGGLVANNIFTGGFTAGTNGTSAANLTSGTNPQFVSSTPFDAHLKSTSPAINAGNVYSGITDGYVGSAPDQGAYEYQGTNWVPGCSFAGCLSAFDMTIDDSVQGSSINQFAYSGSGWVHGTNLDMSYFNGSVSYDQSAGDEVQISFEGTGIALYGSQWAGIAAISLDGGTESMVDFYAPAQANDMLAWSVDHLTRTQHTVRVRVTGTKNSASSYTYIPVDRVIVTPGLPVSSSVDDAVQGSGTNQFTYSGSGWVYATGLSGQGYFNNSVSYSSTANDSVTFTFTGSGIQLFGCQWGGIAGITLDGQGETLIDFSGASGSNNVELWRSFPVPYGSHTLQVRVTGTKNSNSQWYTYIPVDRVVVSS